MRVSNGVLHGDGDDGKPAESYRNSAGMKGRITGFLVGDGIYLRITAGM